MAATDSPHNRLDSRLVPRCEDLSTHPPPGNYVVVDVLHFSNTVIELLANDAAYVHLTDERGEELGFKRERPDAVIGGGSTPGYRPEAGYDFFNSPSFVQRLDVAGRPVSMTSSNGGRTVVTLRDRVTPDSEVFVGSTTNARALAHHLRDSPKPTFVVSAGRRGEVAVEDHVGAALVSRYLDGIPPAEAELAVFAAQVAVAKGEDYVDKHEVRRRDVLEFATQFNSRSALPRLDGDVLVDAAGPDVTAG